MRKLHEQEWERAVQEQATIGREGERVEQEQTLKERQFFFFFFAS